MGAILGQTMAYDRTVEDTALAASIKEVVSSANVAAVFLYDTKHDSDCGHWRSKCAGLSWYDEASSATRSARSEFPSRALIVADNTSGSPSLSIYDADDPALPLWIKFTTGTGFIVGPTTASYSSVSALNGRVYLGRSTNGFYTLDFVNDLANFTNSSNGHYERYFLSGRNTNLAFPLIDSARKIVNDAVNDVVAHVYPGANLDRIGVPIPTVAVATDGGVSVIHPSGDVYDSSSTTAKKTINFNNVGQILAAFYNATESAIQIYDYVDTFADGFGQQSLAEKVHASASAFKCNFLGSNPLISILSGRIAVGTDEGVTLYNYNRGDIEESAVAYITSKYNTGFMHGDIRGAWGLDKDHAATIVGSDLVTNGTFATDTDWTKGTGWTISAGTASSDGTQTAESLLSQSVTVTANKQYILEYTVSGYTAGNVHIELGNATGSPQAANGTYTEYLTPTAGGSVTLALAADADFVGSIDDVTVRLAIEDRSVKNKGLGVYGTINVGAVATGADLRALSGFSASNYAEQPYNSDLDFGTSDFAIYGWVKVADIGATNETIMRRADAAGTGNGQINLRVKSGKAALWISDDNVVTLDEVESVEDVDNDEWVFVWGQRFGSNLYIYVNGEFSAKVAITNAAGSISNTTAVTRIGLNVNDTNPFSGSIGGKLRWSATPGTPDQIKEIYELERPLFFDNAKCTLEDDQVNDVSFDPVTRILEVAEEATTGSSRISGLEVIEVVTSDDDYGLAASKELDLIDSMGGYRVAVTDGGAGANLPSEEIRDSLNEPGHKGYDSHVVHFDGVTTDGSATVIGRIYVEEGEAAAITAHFQGKDYTDPTSKYAHYTVAAHIARPIGGDITLNDTVKSVHTATESSAGYDATMIVTTASQTIGFEVTGADRMVWTAHVECEWELKKI